MATTKDYISFILDQLSGLEDITCRSMMGEYIIYYRGKIAAYVCDNRLLVKPVDAAKKYIPDGKLEPPYEGAKDMLFVEDVDSAEYLKGLFESIYEELPMPKPKKKTVKKEYREFYLPKNKPEFVDVPEMNYIAVRGTGNPNEEGGAYKASIGLLYGIAFTIKMSKKGGHEIKGYFDYVVPPLEGFWWQEGIDGIDYTKKETFQWISVIRLPDFVTKADFEWAVSEAEQKKKQDYSKVEFLTVKEGLCVQCMHIGAYDEEPATIAKMDQFLSEQGYENDFGEGRLHHEIYLSDARRVAPEKRKTVIRHPVRKSIC